MKKAPPLPPGKAQRPPPKPPKLESKEPSTSSTSVTEDLAIEVPVRPNLPASAAKESTMAPDGATMLDSASKDIAASSSLITNNATISEHHHQQQEQSSADQPVLILDNEHVKPNVELLPGWICVWSKSKQRWYFFDTKTNNSVWNWPP
jgi:WW domain